ncbi:helix-turn-helix domain-containing protein [Devosia sp. SL43]|uniref:helix-turn-helix domain-containing protein n=1 Tax=Devosia sp. SL43 TaxID=2806348 RepID=UPI001F02E7E5|nr:helix-turn-helix domain-containing protein [Devosia sp. SL43]UJW85659.1 helix-turn-helix domain-containing protein [Devosia sp. SL43]
MLTQLNHLQTSNTPTPTGPHDAVVRSMLANTRPCAVSFYHPNEVIYAQGETGGPLYLVEFGTVRICRLTADGRRQINSFHFAGEVFGFEPGGEHRNYAESVDNAGVRLLRPNADNGLGANELAIALRTLSRIQDHLLLLGRMNASEKVAAFLVDLLDRQDAVRFIDLSMQRSDIADYLGLTFETVSRVLKLLKDSGVIRLPSVSQVEVMNQSALVRLAG